MSIENIRELEEVRILEKIMEEIAAAPREPYVRQPGERCMYERS